ncbi:augmin complex subunit msd5 [Anastrepha obliqua]|uniref:augmin complex subunit msd5 n=1 Tax=Anastrepha obliqua TaxID=95512 RepID=UPI00240908DD|nr:augmin complex subunit msd5 [Anastrepha obliqua]
MSEFTDFEELSKHIYKNYKEHEKNIKENRVKTSIISLSDFYEGYQREIKEINSEITPSRDNPKVTDFADIFKTFEEYPSNLQKPKRQPTREQLQRMNSTTARDMTIMISSSEQSPCSTSLQNLIRSTAELPSASEIYTDFRKFQQKLAQFLAEVEQHECVKSYESKLDQLCAFGKQLEKLRPTTNNSGPAFTEQEEIKLQAILTHLEQLNYIRENQEIFSNGTLTVNGQSARSESFMNLITYLFNTVSNM